MATLKPGDVVVADFPGITGVKRRPAVVISTDEIFARQEVGELLKRDTASVDASFRAVETGAEVEGLRGEQSDLLSDDLAELAEDWDLEELGFSDEEMSTKLDSALSDLATCIDDMAS